MDTFVMVPICSVRSRAVVLMAAFAVAVLDVLSCYLC